LAVVEFPGWATAPRYAGEALASVLFTAVRRCGIELPAADADPALPATLPGPSGSAPARSVIVVLADGLGERQLVERRGHAPFAANLPRATWITGFPSTTVASLGTLGTGRSPGATALAGYSLRDPATGQLAVLIKWDTPTPPTTWQPIPTVFERLDAVGHPATFIGEERFKDSPMTSSSLRGARFVGAKTPGDRVEAAVTAARGGGLVYLYWGDLDKIGHEFGWESPKWSAGLEALDDALRDLTRLAPKGTELWVTADHGMVDVTGGPRWDVAQTPGLAEQVDVVAGEQRTLHLYTGQADTVAARWRDILGDQACVLTRDQAIDLGLFGAVTDRARPYLGDVIVAMASNATVVDSRIHSAGALAMVGPPGSLPAAALEIPRISTGPSDASGRGAGCVGAVSGNTMGLRRSSRATSCHRPPVSAIRSRMPTVRKPCL
jgi:hypothetical protein